MPADQYIKPPTHLTPLAAGLKYTTIDVIDRWPTHLLCPLPTARLSSLTGNFTDSSSLAYLFQVNHSPSRKKLVELKTSLGARGLQGRGVAGPKSINNVQKISQTHPDRQRCGRKEAPPSCRSAMRGPRGGGTEPQRLHRASWFCKEGSVMATLKATVEPAWVTIPKLTAPICGPEVRLVT